MKRTFSVGAKLAFGYAAVIGITVVMAIVAVKLGSDLDEAVNSEAKKITSAGHVAAAVCDMLSLERAMVLHRAERAAQAELSKEFKEKFGEAEQAVRSLEGLVESGAEQRALTDLAAGLTDWSRVHQSLVETLEGSGDPMEQLRVLEDLEHRLEAAMDGLGEQQAVAMAESQKAAALNRWVVLLLIPLSALIGLAVFVLLRSVVRSLKSAASKMAEGARQVAGSAELVSSLSQSLASGATEQAACLEETTAAGEQVKTTARKNGSCSREAAELFSGSIVKLDAAQRALDEMVSAMSDIQAQSGKISKIIKTIDEIAFQTNILALNAAVEAARAGEMGMGFAVVADEVRNLAQRSGQAASETSAMISESIDKSNAGMSKVEQVSVALREMASGTSVVRGLVDQVAGASQEQGRGIEEITKALAEIETVTQKVAANAEESASAAEELSAQSNVLDEVSQELVVLLGGGEARRHAY